MNELEKRFHQVMGGMIGNESLAASLDESAASELFSWGQTTAKSIVDETDGLDDDAAEERMAPRLRALRLMMRAVGRWTGEAGTLDAESRLALWDRVGEQARVIFGESYVLPSMDEVLAQLPSGASAAQVVMWLKTLFEERKPKG
jgi:hypothetical protein